MGFGISESSAVLPGYCLCGFLEALTDEMTPNHLGAHDVFWCHLGGVEVKTSQIEEDFRPF